MIHIPGLARGAHAPIQKTGHQRVVSANAYPKALTVTMAECRLPLAAPRWGILTSGCWTLGTGLEWNSKFANKPVMAFFSVFLKIYIWISHSTRVSLYYSKEVLAPETYMILYAHSIAIRKKHN